MTESLVRNLLLQSTLEQMISQGNNTESLRGIAVIPSQTSPEMQEKEKLPSSFMLSITGYQD